MIQIIQKPFWFTQTQQFVIPKPKLEKFSHSSSYLHKRNEKEISQILLPISLYLIFNLQSSIFLHGFSFSQPYSSSILLNGAMLDFSQRLNFPGTKPFCCSSLDSLAYSRVSDLNPRINHLNVPMDLSLHRLRFDPGPNP